MRKTMKEKYKEILDAGVFFEHFPTLTGVWEQDKDNFPDLFRVKQTEMQVEAEKILQKNEDSNTLSKKQVFNTSVVMAEKGNSVEPKIIEKILNRHSFSKNKLRVIQIHIQKILLDLELYNLDCEKGFEISIDELISYYKSTLKRSK